MSARIDHTVTRGVFELDGGRWEVDNNVWVVGDGRECVVIDAPHDAPAITALVGGRRVVAIVCTHAHSDHVNVAPELGDSLDAPVLLHTAERELWDLVHPHRPPDSDLAETPVVTVAGSGLQVLHTPGHSPGGCCLYMPDLGVLFSGDTLFAGGPGATGRSFSDFPTIIDSIRSRLLTLPLETVVYPGHGRSTTIAAEAPHLGEWIARGY